MSVATRNDLKNTMIANNAVIRNTFVAKEQGKGLSTNDFTTAEKTKLANLNVEDNTDMTSEEITALMGEVWATNAEPES